MNIILNCRTDFLDEGVSGPSGEAVINHWNEKYLNVLRRTTPSSINNYTPSCRPPIKLSSDSDVSEYSNEMEVVESTHPKAHSDSGKPFDKITSLLLKLIITLFAR